MGKVIAIDFGLQRTGLAMSDDSRTFAFGRDTVPSANLMNELKKLIPQEKIDTIVLGLPLALNAGDTDITANVRLLFTVLEKEFPLCNCVLLDERFTSKMAAQALHIAGASRKQKHEKGMIDKVSATILLQNFLDQTF